MKNTLLFLIIFALSATAGTINNPTQIENGVETTYTTDNNQNYYSFIISGKGAIHIQTKPQRHIQNLISIEIINIYDSSMRKINSKMGEITQGLQNGKYILQITTGFGQLGELPAGTFVAYSSSMPEKKPNIVIKLKD